MLHLRLTTTMFRRAAGQFEPPLSSGSAGHPHNCAGACRYVKRKGGCREGSKCSNCHLCFWRRDVCNTEDQPRRTNTLGIAAAYNSSSKSAGVDPLQNKPIAEESIGTRGHPNTCAQACKYVRRKTGCRDGAACTNCHSCVWRRNPAWEPDLHGLPQEAQGELFSGSRETLQGLFHSLIQTRTENPSNVNAGTL